MLVWVLTTIREGSDVVGLNLLIGCRGAMLPEKFNIFNFIRVASDASDAPDASFGPRQTLHSRRRHLNRPFRGVWSVQNIKYLNL